MENGYERPLMREGNVIEFPGANNRLQPFYALTSQAEFERDLLCMANYLNLVAGTTNSRAWLDSMARELRGAVRMIKVCE